MQLNNPPIGIVVKNGKLIYSEILIHSTPEKVWSVLIDFKNYPNWNPFIKSLKGNPATDKTIEVFLQPPGQKGMTFKPAVLTFTPNKEFRWIGKLLIRGLFDGEHVFILQDNQNGTTTFIQYERFRGILVPFVKKMLEENTLKGFEIMNEAINSQLIAHN